jgi:hypothetical protein
LNKRRQNRKNEGNDKNLNQVGMVAREQIEEKEN